MVEETQNDQPIRTRVHLEPHLLPPFNQEHDRLLPRMSLGAMLMYGFIIATAIYYAPSGLLEFTELDCLWCPPPPPEGSPGGLSTALAFAFDAGIEEDRSDPKDENLIKGATDGLSSNQPEKDPSGDHDIMEPTQQNIDPKDAARPAKGHLGRLFTEEPVPYTRNFLSLGLRARAHLDKPVLIEEGTDQCSTGGVIPVFEQAMPQFNDCFNVARADGEIFGQLKTKLILNKTGKVRQALFVPIPDQTPSQDQIAPMPEIKHDGMRQCIDGALRKLSFPCIKKQGEPVKIVFPLKFLPPA